MRKFSTFAATSLLAPLFSAQTGPWVDGELLVRSVVDGTHTQALYRVAPETGHGEELISGFYWTGWAGSLAFDSFRGGLLANMALAGNPSFQQLWLVSWDGSTTPIPGFEDQSLRAITPVGDGRVFLQRDPLVPTWEIEYLDAGNNVHYLMDSTGTMPFQFSVEHMLFHEPTNSLIATTSGWWSPNDCVSGLSSVFRIPLSSDGTRVAGPVVCASVAGVDNSIQSLDYLPGGEILMNMAASHLFKDTLRVLDPDTLGTTPFASPSAVDLNGAVWSSRIGKAVLLDDGDDVLRAFTAGESGPGTVLPTDFAVSPITSGNSPVETIGEVDLNGPGCIGTHLSLGPGLAGTAGLVPRLAVEGCPDIAKSFTLAVDDVLAGSIGVLAFGFGSGAAPYAGGMVYIEPIVSWALIPVSGSGEFDLPTVFANPALAGFSLVFQAGFVDPAAVQGVSLTNGLWVSLG